LLLFFLFVGLAASIWFYAKTYSRRIFREARESFEFEVNRDLPQGSDESRVSEFLNARRIMYGHIEPNPNVRDDPTRDVWLFDPWYKNANRVIQGNGPWIRPPLGQCRIVMEFKFDKNAKLLGYRDHPTCKESLF
jgi:hypothetical protein